MEDEVEDIELRPASVRRNLTIKNNVARQVAINFMPSRQVPFSMYKKAMISK